MFLKVAYKCILCAGKIPFEGFGAYAVSKHGIEAYSDVLRLEMRKWDVHVAMIEPSGFLTGNGEYRLNFDFLLLPWF